MSAGATIDNRDHRRPSIRWARGFFRGWVVLAVLWALLLFAIGFAAWQNARSPYLYDQTHIFGPDTKLVRNYDSYGQEHEAAEDAVRRGVYRHVVRSFAGRDHDFYVPATVSEADSDAMTDGVFASIVSDAQQASWSAFQSAIPSWLTWLLLPPLVVLAAGATLAWVLRGFAR